MDLDTAPRSESVATATIRKLRKEYPDLLAHLDLFETNLMSMQRSPHTARIYAAQARSLAARVLNDVTQPSRGFIDRRGPGDLALIWRMFMAFVTRTGHRDVLPAKLQRLPMTTPAGDLLDAAGLGAAVRTLWNVGLTPDRIHVLTLGEVLGPPTDIRTYPGFAAEYAPAAREALWNIVSWGYAGVEVNPEWPVFPKHPADPRKRNGRVPGLPVAILWDLAARPADPPAPLRAGLRELPIQQTRDFYDLLALPERAPSRRQMLTALSPRQRTREEIARDTVLALVDDNAAAYDSTTFLSTIEVTIGLPSVARSVVNALVAEGTLMMGQDGAKNIVVWRATHRPSNVAFPAEETPDIAPLPEPLLAAPVPAQTGWSIRCDLSQVKAEHEDAQVAPEPPSLFDAPEVPL
jgi:hypothetical protein